MRKRLTERSPTVRMSPVSMLLSLMLALGCSPEQAMAPGAKANAPPSFMMVCDPSAGCTDPSISANNSYLTADIVATTTATYSSSVSFPDPQTHQPVYSLTVSSPPEHLHVQAGYDASGQPVIRTTFTDGADPQSDATSQITSMVTATNTTTERNMYGQPLVDETTPDAPDPTPMNLLGDLRNANVTSGAILNVNGTISSIRLSAAQIQSVVAVAKKQNPGVRVVVDQPSPSLLRIQETIAMGPSGQSSVSGGAAPPLGASNGDRGIMHHSRLYEQRGGKWLLKELRSESDQNGNGHSEHLEHLMKVNILAWSQNAAKDAERDAKRATAEVIPIPEIAASSQPSSAVLGKRNPKALYYCDPTVDPTCSGGGAEEALAPMSVPIWDVRLTS